MNKENVIFTVCGFVLGMIAGALLLGPWIARMQSDSPRSVTAGATATPGVAATDSAAASPVMTQVLQEINSLQAVLEKDPKNFSALVRLGNLYMDAMKWDRAADYYARAAAIRRDPDVLTDLGICYRQMGRPEQALQIFEDVQQRQPEHWQSAFNQAIALADLGRLAEARKIAERLKREHPDEPDVERLASALATMK